MTGKEKRDKNRNKISLMKGEKTPKEQVEKTLETFKMERSSPSILNKLTIKGGNSNLVDE